MQNDLPFDTRVRLHVYRHFLGAGRPPAPGETAAALGVSTPDVEAALQRLHDGHVLVLHTGTTDIWMANPLSAVPTAYTVHLADRTWYGNCIWDAFGVAAMIGGDATVRSTCPDCAEPLAAEIKDQVLVTGQGVVHFAVPASHWWDDIGHT